MDLNLIAERYRAEMTGSFERLADMVREGRLRPRQFLEGQRKIYNVYRLASMQQTLVAMG